MSPKDDGDVFVIKSEKYRIKSIKYENSLLRYECRPDSSRALEYYSRGDETR